MYLFYALWIALRTLGGVILLELQQAHRLAGRFFLPARRLAMRCVVCPLVGHRSTSNFQWYICDGCHADFGDSTMDSMRLATVKVTRSPGLFRR